MSALCVVEERKGKVTQRGTRHTFCETDPCSGGAITTIDRGARMITEVTDTDTDTDTDPNPDACVHACSQLQEKNIDR